MAAMIAVTAFAKWGESKTLLATQALCPGTLGVDSKKYPKKAKA
jgi:hypothetical protein